MPPRTRQLDRFQPTYGKKPTKASAANKSPDKRTSKRVARIHRDVYGKCKLLDGIWQWEHNVEWEEEEKNLSDEEDEVDQMFFRVANSFAFIRQTSKGIQMVPAIELEEGDVELIAWVGSLSGGARRVTLKLSGHTPPKETREGREKRVWGDDCQVVRVKVNKLESVRRQILLFNKKCVWAVAANGRSAYMLQNPWYQYKDAWKATRDWYNAQGKQLAIWEDLQPAAPREHWANTWATQVIRLSNGYPIDHQDDPPPPPLDAAAKKAALRKSGRGSPRKGKRRSAAKKRTKAKAKAKAKAKTKAVGKGKGKGKGRAVDESQSEESDEEDDEVEDDDDAEGESEEFEGADEVGISDATSVTRDDDDECPTGPSWRDGNPPEWHRAQFVDRVAAVRRTRVALTPDGSDIGKMGAWSLDKIRSKRKRGPSTSDSQGEDQSQDEDHSPNRRRVEKAKAPAAPRIPTSSPEPPVSRAASPGAALRAPGGENSPDEDALGGLKLLEESSARSRTTPLSPVPMEERAPTPSAALAAPGGQDSPDEDDRGGYKLLQTPPADAARDSTQSTDPAETPCPPSRRQGGVGAAIGPNNLGSGATSGSRPVPATEEAEPAPPPPSHPPPSPTPPLAESLGAPKTAVDPPPSDPLVIPPQESTATPPRPTRNPGGPSAV